MPPKKPRQSEPGPSPSSAAPSKKPRTSLPALPRSSPAKPNTKRKSAGSDDDDYSAPSKAAKGKSGAQVKKKVKVVEEVQAEGEEEEDEEIEEEVENSPAKRSTKPTVKNIANAAKKSSAASSKSKNTRQGSSKGEDKIGEIYAAGSELLADTSVKKRAATISTTLDKLEKQLAFPVDQLKKMGHERQVFFKTVDGLHIPIKAMLDDRAEFQKSLIKSIAQYEQLPEEAKIILSTLDKAQKAAVASGLKCIEDSQDFTAFTRGAKRFLAWTR